MHCHKMDSNAEKAQNDTAAQFMNNINIYIDLHESTYGSCSTKKHQESVCALDAD